MLLLVIALTLTGCMAQDWSNMEMGEINFEWQELNPGKMRLVDLEDWMNRGFSFQINTGNSSSDNYRALAFLGGAPDYEYLGYMGWSQQGGVLIDATESEDSCGLQMFDGSNLVDAAVTQGLADSDDMSGRWDVMFDKEVGNISVWFSNEENGVDKEMVLNEYVAECASWMMNVGAMSMNGFSDETVVGDNGQMKKDYYMYAMYTVTAGDCKRGEFFWMEKCNKCPPGKSTVKEGYTEYSDCIDMRYIECKVEEMGMECERSVCPCNENYEECDWDMESKSYGMCMQKSDYYNSARGVAGATTLVTMVAAFFSL